MEYVYTEKNLQPYNAYPRLYRERRRVEKPTGMPFPFLKLQPELRVETNWQCLVCIYAIDLVGLTFKKDRRDKIATRILRTCGRIDAEGSQVLPGDNEFRIWRSDNFLNLPYISRHDFDRLKELTVSVPFMDYNLILDDIMTIQNAGSITSSQSIFKAPNTDYEQTKLLRNLLRCIVEASRLRRLHLVIPPWWEWPIHDKSSNVPHDDWLDRSEFRLHDPDTWDDLKTLLEHKPSLEVTVTRLYVENQCKRFQWAHNSLLRRLRHNLGIWDHREALMTIGIGDWTMPPRTEINPEVSQRDMNLLFGDILSMLLHKRRSCSHFHITLRAVPVESSRIRLQTGLQI
ncbi:hypothetical protein BKA63DRAFT_495113 [Paraphoma chrysanthemicola]|nr:hypothetical protein BKA63DRAFT_495113 [Paraphoma chrysanthemicola]